MQRWETTMLDPTEQCLVEHGPNRCHLQADHDGMHRWDSPDGERYRWGPVEPGDAGYDGDDDG